MLLKVPGEVVSVALGAAQYPVKDGVVDVPDKVVGQLLDAGFTPCYDPPPAPEYHAPVKKK
jgi:hypothetical protein